MMNKTDYKGGAPRAALRLFCLAFACVALWPAAARAQDAKPREVVASLQTSAGALSIVRVGEDIDLTYVLRLGEKDVYEIEGDMYVSFVAHFPGLSAGEVVLMMRNSGGSACPAQFQFVLVEGAGRARVSETFGDCGDAPTVTLQQLPEEQISVRFQGYYRLSQQQEPGFRRPPPSTWLYRKGVLTEAKATAPQPRRRGR